jgi:lipopolysaccharide heptosyltransferase I
MIGRKRIPLIEYPASRICIIKPSALGDIIHALPVLTALRQRFPEAHISWVVNRAYQGLLEDHPELNATIPFDRNSVRGRGFWRGISGLRQFFRDLQEWEFDLVVDLQGLFRSGLMTWMSKAPRRVGLNGAREGATWFYTDVVAGPARKGGHAVDRYFSVARALGATGEPVFHFPNFADEHCWATVELVNWPRPWIMTAVGSRWPTKRWLPSHFGELFSRTQADFGGSIIFVGGNEDVEASTETARRLSGPHHLLAGRTTLPQLTALLARADVVVANDTGPLHLACALGRPVVAPYTCTRAALTGPYGQLKQAVETTVWCAGSLHKRCSRMECMGELTPHRVWSVLSEVLQRWEYNSRSA